MPRCHRLDRTLLLACLIAAPSAHAATAVTLQDSPRGLLPASAPLDAPRHVRGELLVGFEPGTSAQTRAAAHAQLGAALQRRLRHIDVDVVSVPPAGLQGSLQAYRRISGVRFAELNHLRSLSDHLPSEGVEPWPYGGTIDFLHEQWGLHNTGQSFYYDEFTGALGGVQGVADADIDFAEAWHHLDGQPVDAGIVVAVLDSGVDCSNEDLAGKCVEEVNFGPSEYGHDDILGHGTHVAGTAAAETGNGAGVAGVGWNARIADLKVCYEEYDWLFGYYYGLCADADIAEGLMHAADQGYHVANMSFAGEVSGQTVQNAIVYAASQGMLLVAGAGNAYSLTPMFPASYAQVLSVGASDHFDNLAGFSSFGSGTVDLLAPGSRIISTISVQACGQPDCYGWNSGTSMAAPHVSGAGALVWGRMQALGLGPTGATVRAVLEDSADVTGALGQNFLAWVGSGRLNLASAILAAEGGTPPPPPPGGAEVHVGDLDASSVNQGGTWRADVTVTVHTGGETAVSGASVLGSWSGGTSGTASCTSDGQGRCVLQSASVPKRNSSVTLTITAVNLGGSSYRSSLNHDPDGDSTGTAIVVLKP